MYQVVFNFFDLTNQMLLSIERAIALLVIILATQIEKNNTLQDNMQSESEEIGVFLNWF